MSGYDSIHNPSLRRSGFVFVMMALFLFSLESFQPVSAQNFSFPGPDSLRILTWNLYLLPKPLVTGQKKRVKEIVQVLNQKNQWDVVILQEVFIPSLGRKIKKELKEEFPFAYGPAGKSRFLKYNGGVMILTKNKASASDSIIFTGACEGSDCYSQKGAVFVEIEKNGKKIQVVGTHTQAMNTKKSERIRVGQFKQIVERLLKPNEREKVPQIIAGDLNTDYFCDSCYQEMLQTFEAEDTECSKDRVCTFDGKNNELIPREKGKIVRNIFDYILVKKRDTKIRIANTSVQKFRAPWGKNKRDLADHYAVETLFIFD